MSQQSFFLVCFATSSAVYVFAMFKFLLEKRSDWTGVQNKEKRCNWLFARLAVPCALCVLHSPFLIFLHFRTCALTSHITNIMEEDQSNVNVGDRVLLLKFTDSQEYGTVRYVGKTSFAKGTWIGVACDNTGR